MTGIAVGGCCELSTSAHHLIDKIGTEQGYLLAESNGLDIDDAIHVAKRLLKGRIARQVWRGFHKHAFARRCYADPSDANLAEQHRARKQHDDDQDERQERQLIHQFCGWRHAQTHAHAGASQKSLLRNCKCEPRRCACGRSDAKAARSVPPAEPGRARADAA